ncbi:PstA family ABC transporter permease, partial [Phascolarctobacterium succinatutens]|uniref:PstA family ABC transporter permease n=1 Tax=Phascolarctobacterium succinatutens TaxID=626940 RepID=UPI0026F06C0F
MNGLARAKFMDKLMTVVFYCVAGFFIFLLVGLALYVIGNGFRNFSFSLISFEGSSLGNLLFNTLYLVFLSLLVSVPLGVAAGIYMAEYAKAGRFTRFLRMCIETMSSLPSIVVGLFGYLVFIVMTGAQWNLFSGALAVSILSIPLIMTVTEDAFKSLPEGYKRGSLAMGATLWQTIYKVLLP